MKRVPEKGRDATDWGRATGPNRGTFAGERGSVSGLLTQSAKSVSLPAGLDRFALDLDELGERDLVISLHDTVILGHNSRQVRKPPAKARRVGCRRVVGCRWSRERGGGRGCLEVFWPGDRREPGNGKRGDRLV